MIKMDLVNVLLLHKLFRSSVRHLRLTDRHIKEYTLHSNSTFWNISSGLQPISKRP